MNEAGMTARGTMLPLSADHQGAVMVNGKSVVSGNAVVAADDLGLIRGDGVFDFFRVYRGVPFALEDHLDRLARSAAAIHLGYDRGKLESEVFSMLKRMKAKDGHVRIVLTRSGSRLLFEEPPFEPPTHYRLMLVPHAVSPLMSGVKSLSYAVNCHAGRVAEESGCEDALFFSVANGEILECPFASFAWVKDRRLFTPPLAAGILDSITRRIVLEVSHGKERTCTRADLAEADEALVMGTATEVVPVAAIASVRSFPESSPFVTEIAQRVHERIQARLQDAVLSLSSGR
jgi:branched-subunit amino acid aminotransferase/4-amino-4-deoxychorismate lyase